MDSFYEIEKEGSFAIPAFMVSFVIIVLQTGEISYIYQHHPCDCYYSEREMRHIIYLLVVAVLALSACCGIPACSTGTPEQVEINVTPTVTGTWKTVIEGLIYDQSAGSDKPIPGATVTYDVLHSYFPELQEGRLNKTISNQRGEFSFRVMVHDTDSIKILIEAQGYIPYEERLVGIDLLAGRHLEVGLTRR